MEYIDNPFVTYGYESPEYFCDRVQETETLARLLTNGNNVALISPRRMGKTGLLHHCFNQPCIKETYNTFIVDIYATKTLEDFVFQMGKVIVQQLRSFGHSAMDKFLHIVTSLRTGISFDGNGNASWNIGIGDIKNPMYTLDEIFLYLQKSDKRCIVAIDEFQTINTYPDANIEALLRTYVQNCRNTVFVFSGSQRHMMNEMFSSPARPFYQSVSLMNIGPITLDKYVPFAKGLFNKGGKDLADGIVEDIYERFNATTWYIQKLLNELYSITPIGNRCDVKMVETALNNILSNGEPTYQETVFLLTVKQVTLLKAICKEGQANKITSGKFIKHYNLTSASSVQKAAKVLLEKHLITYNMGTYEPYDKFFALWLNITQ